jgi:hypothetical protein
MFTAAECRSIANQKLAQAEHDDRHRRRLTAAAEAWLFLAYKLSGEDTALSTQGAGNRCGALLSRSRRRHPTQARQAMGRIVGDEP